MKMIKEDIDKSGYTGELGSGIVLSGGASELQGLVEMGEFIFDVPVRSGPPSKIGGLFDVVNGPRYATAVGLILHAYEKEHAQMKDNALDNVAQTMESLGQRMKDFFNRSI